MDRYFSCFLDDIKAFEPSEEVDSIVEWQSDATDDAKGRSSK